MRPPSHKRRKRRALEQLAAQRQASARTLIDQHDGPWKNEPDDVQWDHHGYACYMVRATNGVWMGYVGVPKGHAFYRVHHDVLPASVQVHNGLSYSGPKTLLMRLRKADKRTLLWWFGFECGNLIRDYLPGHAPLDAQFAAEHPELPKIPQVLYVDEKAEAAGAGERDFEQVYRSLPMVKRWTEQLAEQLAGVALPAARRQQVAG